MIKVEPEVLKEIYLNPYDLEITVGRENRAEEFSISITRGPGDIFRYLVLSEPAGRKTTVAFAALREILNASLETGQRECPGQSNVLTPELIDHIITVAGRHDAASTYKMRQKSKAS